MPFVATGVDLEIVILSELSETEKEKYCMTILICGIWKEMIQMNLQNRKRLTDLREWIYGCWGEGCGEGIVREFGMDMYTLLYLKWITNKDLLSSTGNSAQCDVAAWMRWGEFRGEWIHVYGWLSPFTVHLKLSQHCLLIGCTPIQNKKVKKRVASFVNTFVFFPL